MTLEEKAKVLEELDAGMSLADIGRRHKVNQSTVRTIRQAKDKIRNSIRSSTDVSNKVACVSRRDPLLEKVESALAQWIDIQALEKHSDVSYGAVRTKVLSRTPPVPL